MPSLSYRISGVSVVINKKCPQLISLSIIFCQSRKNKDRREHRDCSKQCEVYCQYIVQYSVHYKVVQYSTDLPLPGGHKIVHRWLFGCVLCVHFRVPGGLNTPLLLPWGFGLDWKYFLKYLNQYYCITCEIWIDEAALEFLHEYISPVQTSDAKSGSQERR